MAGSPGRTLRLLLAALALALAGTACGDDDAAFPVDDPDATLERLEELRLRSWEIPGSFALASQGPSRNEDVASRSPNPNQRLDEFTRWGRVIGYSQEFLATDRALAVRFLTVIYRTEDGAARALEATASGFDAIQVPVVRSEASVASPLGQETRAWRLVYDPEGERAEGHYITWRRGRALLSVQTLGQGEPADQSEAEEMAAVLDRRFTGAGAR